MKKLIISALAAAALLFGFASCTGDLHDDVAGTPVELDGYYLIGSMTDGNWKLPGAIKFTKESSYKYTVDFTASDTEDTFAFLPSNANWDGQIGGDKILAGTGSDDGITYKQADNGYGGINAVLKGLTAGATYKMTIDSSAGIKVSINATTAKATPVPYYLDGYYLHGEIADCGWSDNPAYLIRGAATDSQTGVVTYTLNFTASKTFGYFAIVGKNDRYYADVKTGDDAVKTTKTDDTMKSGQATGLTVDSPYQVIITTTPKKEVSVAIKQIVSYTITFEVTGLSKGNAVYINGSFWEGWANGWPIDSWNSKATKTAVIADENGVATFDSAWNVTNIADPGADLSFEFKAIATTSKDTWDTNGADILNPSSNMSCEIEDVEAATYKVSIDAETEEVTVTKL